MSNISDDERRELQNLRELFEHVCQSMWAIGCDIEAADWQDKAEALGLLVEVPASEEVRAEYDCETMFTWAWSDAAKGEEGET